MDNVVKYTVFLDVTPKLVVIPHVKAIFFFPKLVFFLVLKSEIPIHYASIETINYKSIVGQNRMFHVQREAIQT